jgi:pimeloyl-ACP methyl ester carboxylesterase
MDHHILMREPAVRTKSPPVVFIHGAWHAAWCWEDHFLAYFADKGYVALAPNLPGHGASADLTALRWRRIDDYVTRLAEVIRGLAAPPILVGHSMGGLVVQKYLEQAPAEAAILLAPVPAHGAVWATVRTVRRIPRQFLKANAQLRLYPLIETEELAREAFFSPTIPPSLLKRHFSRLQDESYLAFLDMVVFRLPRPKRVSTPLLVLGAENDAIFRPKELEATATAYAAQVKIFPEMAHDMMLEPGWQAVADYMLTWLEARGL